MRTPTSNVIAFPLPAFTRLSSKAPSLPVPLIRVTSPSDHVSVAVVAVNRPPSGAEDIEAMHAADVVRASIRFARRKGVALESLPSMLRLWLLRQCDRGDPACLMVREWLTGNRRFLTDIECIEQEKRR